MNKDKSPLLPMQANTTQYYCWLQL